MVFIRDTEQSLEAAVYLVNTLPGFDDEDTLLTVADFDAYLAVNPYTGAIRRDESELDAVRSDPSAPARACGTSTAKARSRS